MIFEAKNFQNGSHVTTIIQNFTLISLTSSVISHPVKLLLGAAVFSHPMYLDFYVFDSSSFYVTAGKTFCLGIYLKLFTFQGMQLLSSIIIINNEELSCGLDVINLLPCIIVSLIVSIGWSNWLDDKRSPSKMSSS